MFILSNVLMISGCDKAAEKILKNAETQDNNSAPDKLTKTTKHAKRHFWLNDVCTCHGLLPSHSA
jgi:hypothetical protein